MLRYSLVYSRVFFFFPAPRAAKSVFVLFSVFKGVLVRLRRGLRRHWHAALRSPRTVRPGCSFMLPFGKAPPRQLWLAHLVGSSAEIEVCGVGHCHTPLDNRVGKRLRVSPASPGISASRASHGVQCIVVTDDVRRRPDYRFRRSNDVRRCIFIVRR